MSRCIFRKTNSYQHWKLVPLIIIFASAVITLEQEPNSYSQWKGDSNQRSGIMLTRKD